MFCDVYTSLFIACLVTFLHVSSPSYILSRAIIFLHASSCVFRSLYFSSWPFNFLLSLHVSAKFLSMTFISLCVSACSSRAFMCYHFLLIIFVPAYSSVSLQCLSHPSMIFLFHLRVLACPFVSFMFFRFSLTFFHILHASSLFCMLIMFLMFFLYPFRSFNVSFLLFFYSIMPSFC